MYMYTYIAGIYTFLVKGIFFFFHLLISQVEKQINTILQKADYKTDTKESPL